MISLFIRVIFKKENQLIKVMGQ